MKPVAHPCLPPAGRLWGASRPGYPMVPATPRQIQAAVREWAGVGVETVVSLLEDAELAAICPGLLEVLRRHHLESLRFPVPDFGVPRDPAAFAALVEDLRQRLDRGQAILVHCNAGLGRTAIVLAALLKACGLRGDPVEEVRRIYQPGAIRGENQEAFVRALVLGRDGGGPRLPAGEPGVPGPAAPRAEPGVAG